MSEGWHYKGYGRGWGEEKAIGLYPRFCQIMREPATKNTYYFAGGIAIAIWMVGGLIIRFA